MLAASIPILIYDNALMDVGPVAQSNIMWNFPYVEKPLYLYCFPNGQFTFHGENTDSLETRLHFSLAACLETSEFSSFLWLEFYVSC